MVTEATKQKRAIEVLGNSNISRSDREYLLSMTGENLTHTEWTDAVKECEPKHAKTNQKRISVAGKKPSRTVTVRSRSDGKIEKYQVRKDGKVTTGQVHKTIGEMKKADKAKGIKRRYDADAKVTAKTVYSKNPSPAQLSAYRNRPDRRDIEGIDAPRGTANRKARAVRN